MDMKRGRPKIRTSIICKALRDRIQLQCFGNLGEYRLRYLPAVSPDMWYAAMRGEPVRQDLAELIENQGVTETKNNSKKT